MLKKICAALALAFMAAMGASSAHAEQRYNQPMFEGYRLDWCRVWAGECGRPAADAFCRANGHSGVESFRIAENIGGRTPTRVIGSRQVCADGGCDGFEYISCTAPERQRFRRPEFRGYRLDWCRVWAGECGQPAAQAFCESEGYDRVVRFRIAENIGDRTPTRVIGSSQVCADRGCDGFRVIVCERD